MAESASMQRIETFDVMAPEFAAQLEAFARGPGDAVILLPWAASLRGSDSLRLRDELAVVLEEPALTGEPLDWREIRSILAEYAEVAGWDGPLFPEGPAAPPGPYFVNVRDQEL